MSNRLRFKDIELLRRDLLIRQHLKKMQKDRRQTEKHKRKNHLNSDCLKLWIISSIFIIVCCIIMIECLVNYSYDWSADHFVFQHIENHTQSNVFSFWECFTKGIEHKMFDNEYQCILDETAIILNHEIGRGGQGAVYSITINSSQFALKHSYAKDYCYHLKREWITLKVIEPTEYILPLHHKLSKLYIAEGSEIGMHCFIIVTVINNSVTMFDLTEFHENRFDRISKIGLHKIKSDNLTALEWQKDGNELLLFVLNCYQNIKNALDILRGEFIYYSDELIHNVLLNIDNNKCILIDFGLVAEMRDNADIMSSSKHLDHKMKFSPYSTYYLHDFHSRFSIMRRYLFQWKGIKKLRMVAYWNTMHKLGAFALRVFVTFYMDSIRNSGYKSYLNQSSFRELEKLKNRLYNLDKIRRIPANHFWDQRAKEITLIKAQINDLNEKHQCFDSVWTEKFFEILNDIHTEETMNRI